MVNAKRSLVVCILVILVFISFFSPIFSVRAWDGYGEGIIEVIRDPRFSIKTIGPISTFIFADININLHLILRSSAASVNDYCHAILQHFGIDLIADGYSEYPEVFTIILEANGIDTLLNYLKNYFWWIMPSWLVDGIRSEYISSDGGLRLIIPIGFGFSLDKLFNPKIVEIISNSISALIDIYKAFTGKVPLIAKHLEHPELGQEDIFTVALNLVEDMCDLVKEFFNIGFYVFQGSLKVIGNYRTRMLFNGLAVINNIRETLEFFSTLKELPLWISRLKTAIFWLRLGVDFIIPGLGWADLIRIAASTVGSLIYELLDMFWTDTSWWRELVMGAIRVVIRWLDPPETTIYTSVFNQTSRELLLGYNPATGQLITESPIGFIITDNSSQNIVLYRAPSYNLTLSSTGEAPASLPFTTLIIDNYSNETFGSSGWLKSGEKTSLLINVTETKTQFSNYLVVQASPSTFSPKEGDPVIINITVTDSNGVPYAEANVTLLIKNAVWVLADNLGHGFYKATIDTMGMVGLVPVGIYASYPGMTSGYDAILLDIIDVTPPIANAGPDIVVNEDTVVTFNASASWDNVGIVDYTWTFIDVKQQTLKGEFVTYIFNNPGTYVITLNVTDAAGNWATDQLIVTVLDITKPTANAGGNRTVKVGETVVFDAGNSSDNVGVAGYDWDFGDGTTGTGKTIAHVYMSPGVYVVTLTVKDAAGNADSCKITITVLSEGTPIWVIGLIILVITIVTAIIVLKVGRRKRNI